MSEDNCVSVWSRHATRATPGTQYALGEAPAPRSFAISPVSHFTALSMAVSAPSSTAVNASSGSKSSSSAAAEALRPPFFPFFPFFARSTQVDCASAPRGVPFRPSSAQLECFLPTSWPADHGSAGSDARHATCSFMAVPWGRLGSAQAWAKHRRPAEARMHRCNPEAAIIVIVLPAYSSGLCTGG